MLSADRWIYDLMYRLVKPGWDTDVPAPQVISLLKKQAPRNVLDLGCGTGTNAIYLAQHGSNVVGVDLAPKALELARTKAQRANVAIDFRQADVTQIDFLQTPFDLVLDIGCFHGLDKQRRERYVENLARLTHPDSTFLLFAFDRPALFENYGILPQEVERIFAPNFVLNRAAHSTHRNGRPTTWYRFIRR